MNSCHPITLPRSPATKTQRSLPGRPAFPLRTTPQLCGIGHPSRPVLEGFVQRCYEETFGATVDEFMPMLAALTSDAGELMAVAGMRSADWGELFLESYLDCPVEEAISRATGVDTGREEVAEIGNLACLLPGGLRWTTVAMIDLLYANGYRWVVFTAVKSLRNAIVRLGLTSIALAKARPERLGSSTHNWGQYYDHDPMVLAGEIRSARRFLASTGVVGGGPSETVRPRLALGA